MLSPIGSIPYLLRAQTDFTQCYRQKKRLLLLQTKETTPIIMEQEKGNPTRRTQLGTGTFATALKADYAEQYY